MLRLYHTFQSLFYLLTDMLVFFSSLQFSKKSFFVLYIVYRCLLLMFTYSEMLNLQSALMIILIKIQN